MKRYLNILFTLVFSAFFALNISSQCIAPSAFGTASFGACGGVVTATTCVYGGEYSTFNGVIAGNQYTFAATGGSGNFVTLTTTANAVLTFGASPITWTATFSGSVRLHVHTNANCGTEFSCHTTTGNCLTCPPPVQVTCPLATAMPAVPITGGTSVITGNTACSAPAQAVPTCGTTLNTAPGVWHTWVAPCEGTVELNTCTGTTFDSKLGVFTGSCGALTCVAGNDDGCGVQSSVTFPVTSGTTYYLYVTGYSTATGGYTLTLNYTADPCCSAEPLTAYFNPAVITVCPSEPFTGSLVIEGGVPGPANGIAVGNVAVTGFPGTNGGDVATFRGDDGSVMSILGNTSTTDFRGGGAVLKNTLSTAYPNLNDPYYYGAGSNWMRFQNGVETNLGGGLPANFACNAWDNTTQTMYGATAGYPGSLYTVNVNTGAVTLVGPFTGLSNGFAIWIEIDDVTGQMYMFDIADDNVYKVDKTTGACTLLGGAGFNGNYGQDAWFWDGAIYSLAFNSGTFTTQYRKFNLANGSSSLITDFGYAQVGAQGFFGQTFSGGYEIVWNTTIGLTQTGDNWSSFDGFLTEPGVYTYNVTVTDACGATATAQFIVNVLNVPDAMACNDNVIISVQDECAIDVRADMFLEGPYGGCYDHMEVYIWPFGDETDPMADDNVNNQKVDFTNLLGDHMYVIVNSLTGNSCMGTFTAVDKIVPVITCPDDVTVDCYEATPVSSVLVVDNCDNWTVAYADDVVTSYCGEYSETVLRTWTVTDHNNGLTASCLQTIYKERATLADLEWPVNWDGLTQIGNKRMLECNEGFAVDANGNPDPYKVTGGPIGIGYNGSSVGSCGTIEIFYVDRVYYLNCGIKILRDWTVVDDCTGAIATHTQIIRITDTTGPNFMDPEDMVARTKAYVCESDVKVPAIMHLLDGCDLNPRWWVTTNAGYLIGDVNKNGYVDANETWYIIGAPMGKYDLCYHAIDNCGNVTTKCAKLTVIDGVPPIPVCEQYKTASLTAYGHAKIFAEDYDSGSFDNCNPVWFKVLRVNADLVYDGGCEGLNGDDNPKTSPIDVWYDDEVYFCCDDIGNEVMVSLRVFDVNPGVGPVAPARMLPGGDLYGHYNDCWNITLIECKIPPVLTCPPVEITCEESLDPNDNPKLWPGVVSLCGVELEYTDSRDNSTCGANITRTWTAEGCGKTTSCKQTIKVLGTTPFDPCTIVFPADKQSHCTNDFLDGGKPTWDEFPCNVVTSEIVKEDTFKFVEGACYKIIREWAVIDWCVYKPNTGAEDNLDPVTSARKFNCNTLVKDGYYRYTQILKIVDLIPPTIAVEDQCVATVDCYAYKVPMTAIASDTCNTNEEYWWKYIVVNMDTWETVQVSYNYVPKPQGVTVGKRSEDKLDKVKEAKLVIQDPLPIGNYRVTWTVGDGCGNANSKDQFFTVADKKAPTPVMVDIATAIMENNMVELKARWFDKGGCGDGCISSWDNCTPQSGLFFTFTPMLPNLADNPTKWAQQFAQYGRNFFDPATGAISTEAKYLAGTAHAWYPQSRSSSRVWLCDWVEVGDIYETVQIYVWDQFALDADCDDRNFDYANVIVNFNHCVTDPQPMVSGNVALENMTMKATYDEGFFTTMTADGTYNVGVNANESYKVSGTKDTDFLNGVTTLDLVIIQKYLLGLKSITDPKLLLAADINNNGEVTAADLLEARKVILGTKDRFTNNSWIAVDPQTSSRERAITVGTTNVSGIDFDVVKIGDMNKTANALESRNTNSVRLMIDEASVKAGEIVEIPFYAEDFTGVYGAQFTMGLSGTLEEVVSGRLDINESNYNVVNGNLIVSFNDANGVDVTDGSVLFTLKVRVQADANISNVLNINDNVLRSEIYTGKDLEINTLEIGYRNVDASYVLYQNEPNPFVTTTSIGFELPKAANYTLTVFDVTGKELKVINSKGVAGYNRVTIDGISATGVLTYRLESDDFTATKKMVNLK